MNVDEFDWKIIQLLKLDARISLTEIGRQIGLTPPAVGQRVQKLETQGVIRGYHADVNLSAIGLALRVFISIRVQNKKTASFKSKLKDFKEIYECYSVTGSHSFLMKAAIPDTLALEQLVEKLEYFGETETSLILTDLISLNQNINTKYGIFSD